MKDKTQEVRKLMDIVNEGITINEATKIEKMDFLNTNLNIKRW